MSDDDILENDPFENDPVLAKAEPILIDWDGKAVVLGTVPAVDKQEEPTKFNVSVVWSNSKTHPFILDLDIDEEELEEDEDPEELRLVRLHLTKKSGTKLRDLLNELLTVGKPK